MYLTLYLKPEPRSNKDNRMTEDKAIKELIRVWQRTDIGAKDFSMVEAHIRKG